MKDNRSLEQKIREVHEAVLEAAFDRNSKIRMKMANVGRPTDGPSMLAKQGEIKTKVIDEDSVAGVSTKDTPKEQPDSGKKKKETGNEKALMEPGTIQGGKTEVDLEPTTDDRDDDGKKINTDKKATKAANVKAGVKEETMNTTKHFGLPADLISTVAEALKGGQKKLDANKNNKIDAQDFKLLKSKKKVEEEVEELDERDAGNKAKKDAAVAAVGAANKDEKHLTTKGTGIRGSVADKIRGREVTSGKDRMKEEVESIEELSKDTMKSYVKKVDKKGEGDKRGEGLGMASKKIAKKETDRTLQRAVNKIGNTPMNQTKASDGHKYDASRQELKNRGTHNFAGRRTKYEETDPGFSEAELARIEEIEQIDELSKDTLVSYALKAHRRGDMAARMSKKGDGTGYDKDTAHIANKRYDGVQTAIKKIATKEEVEGLDEISQDTKNSYLRKADKQVGRTMSMGVAKRTGGVGIKDTERKIANRKAGIKRAMDEEIDPGFSEAEIARIEEIASNIDEVVTARKLTPSDKAAKEKYLAAHKAKLASHDTGIEPKKSFKDVNSEPGNYTKQPSKMGIRHSIGSGYYKNDT